MGRLWTWFLNDVRDFWKWWWCEVLDRHREHVQIGDMVDIWGYVVYATCLRCGYHGQLDRRGRLSKNHGF